MRLLFASTVPHLPHNVGGMQTSTHALALGARNRGHAVAAFGGLPAAPAVDPSSRDPSAGGPFPGDNRYWTKDEGQGYPTYRARRPIPAFAGVLADCRPDVVIVPFGAGTAPLAAVALELGAKVVLYAHSAEPGDLAVIPIDRPEIRLIANSRFTAARLETILGVKAPIVPPLVDPDFYRVERPGDSVVLINPTLLKGVELFFRLAAARPRVPFLAVESWNIGETWRTVLMNRARALDNVELWTATDTMREVYARARLVLMPSIHEETFGRAVAEAQVSGIPALVADRGALAETLGGGGLAVPLHAGIEAWVAAFDRIWSGEREYRQFSDAARRQAALVGRDADRVMEAFLQVVREWDR